MTAEAGAGPWSAPKTATPATVPTVRLTAGEAGDRRLAGRIIVTDDGGAAPSNCVLFVENERTVACGDFTVGGLDYKTYRLYAYAENSAGKSARSNEVSITFNRPPPPPPPTKYEETLQTWCCATRTFQRTNGSNEGPRIPIGSTVEVSCRKHDPTITSNAGGWWYRVKSSPWNNAYYAPAGDFKSAPVNTSVPVC